MHLALDRVLRTIRQHALIRPADRVVVALSGGPDSVALLHLLELAVPRVGGALAGVVHVNHGLRTCALDDEAFCRDMAERMGLPLVVERVDVRTRASARRISIEATGHEARAEAYARAAAALGADVVAVGHTRSDVAETFLMRLLRGAGASGLSGMCPRAGLVVRPLIDLSRQDVESFLTAQDLAFRRDPSNNDRDILRNRVRHELMPLLEARFNPAVADALAREAAVLRDEDAWIEASATEMAAGHVQSEGGEQRVDAAWLQALPPGLARRVARRVLAQASPGRSFGFAHVEALRRLAGEASPGAPAVSLPGLRAVRDGRWVRVAPWTGARRRGLARGGRAHALNGSRPEGFCCRLAVPGSVSIPQAGWNLAVELVTSPPGAPEPGSGIEVMVDAAELGSALTVRSRRPGDRFRPLGLGGRKKLQDLLVDRKVARQERDLVPIVEDAAGRIVWIVGHALSEDFRVTASTRAVIILKARRLAYS